MRAILLLLLLQQPGGAWHLTASRAVTPDHASVTLELDALNVVRGAVGTLRPVLSIRCLNDKLEAFVATGAGRHRDPDYRAPLRLRWAGGAPHDETWRRSTDYTVVFAPDAATFLRQLLITPEIALEIPRDEGEPVVARFNGEGLDAHLPLLRSRCRNFSTPLIDSVHAEEQVDEKAQMLWRPSAEYPPMLRRAGIQGIVVIEAVVDTLGHVSPGSSRVISTPNAGLNPPALNAVRQALFRPARVQGRAVRVRIQVPIEFRTPR